MQSSAHFILARSWRLASGRVDRVATRPEVTIHWLLRIGCAMCFVGHGAWGVITKSGWVPLYGVFGIPASLAWKTMPVIGAVDITFGALVLFFPFRALFGYMALWTLLTALLRPLAGLGVWEFLERAGNYGPRSSSSQASATAIGWSMSRRGRSRQRSFVGWPGCFGSPLRSSSSVTAALR